MPRARDMSELGLLLTRRGDAVEVRYCVDDGERELAALAYLPPGVPALASRCARHLRAMASGSHSMTLKSPSPPSPSRSPIWPRSAGRSPRRCVPPAPRPVPGHSRKPSSCTAATEAAISSRQSAAITPSERPVSPCRNGRDPWQGGGIPVAPVRVLGSAPSRPRTATLPAFATGRRAHAKARRSTRPGDHIGRNRAAGRAGASRPCSSPCPTWITRTTCCAWPR